MANNKIAYGIAKEQGIDTTGMSPGEVWEALKEKGAQVPGNWDNAPQNGAHSPKPKEEGAASKKPLKVGAMRELYDKIKSGGEVTAGEIVNNPAILKAAEESDARPKTHLINSPERDRLRAEVAQELLSRGSITVDKDEKKSYNGDVEKGYRADIVIGLPAAGKSSVLVEPLSAQYKSRIIDSDDAKALLPEFDNGIGANAVHEESSDIIDKYVTPAAIEKGENCVFAIVGKKADTVLRKAQLLKDKGYEVHLSFNDVESMSSLKRAATRFAETGRFVPFDYIAGVGDAPKRVYEEMKKAGGFASYTQYNNDVPFGQKPKLIEKIKGGGEN